MTQDRPITFLLIGRSGLLDVCIDKILKHGHKIVGLIRQDSKTDEFLPVFDSLAEAKRKLTEPPDILFSIINSKILKEDEISYARLASINYHDSPLPAYAGVNAPSWAILNGERQHGISWHMMTAEVDTGDVLSQRRFEIDSNDTSISLSRKCFGYAVDSFEEVLKAIETNDLTPLPQNLQGRTYYGRLDRLPRGGFIHWRDSAEQISRFVRSADWGEQDNEFGTAKILLPDDSCLSVQKAEILEDSDNQEPGTIVSIEADSIILIAGDHRLIRLTGLKDLDGNAGPISAMVQGSQLPELTGPLGKAVQTACKHAAQEEAGTRKMLASSPAPLSPGNLRWFKYREGEDYCFEKEIASEISLGDAVAPIIAKLIDQDMNLPVLIGIAASPLPSFYHLRPCIISSGKVEAIAASIDRANRGALCPKDLPLRFKDIAKRWGRLHSVRVVISEQIEHQPTNNGLLIIRMKERLQIRFSATQISAEDAKKWQNLLLHDDRSEQVVDPAGGKTCSGLVSRILEHAYSRPQSVAVRSEKSSISYAELDRRSALLAATLCTDGARNEERYAVLLPQSINFPIACLAVFRSGGAFIPLDVSTPVARLERIIHDAKPLAIITDRAHLDLAEKLPCPAIDMESQMMSSASGCWSSPVGNHPNDLAYVVYTSGSSGDPKGCMIEHGSLHHYIETVVDRYEITGSDRVLQLCSVGFDAAIDEVFSALYAGATLVIKPDEMLQSCQQFLDICEREQLTIIGIYASILPDFIHAMNRRGVFPSSVRLVTTGGESVRFKDVEAWLSFFENTKQKSPRFVNNYGLSETTIVNLSADLTKDSVVDGVVPIGQPLPGNECRVVDENMNAVPEGVRGELLLAGDQLERAYWNRQYMNANKFIFDPITKKRWFRTGDLVQISRGDVMSCHGRIDRQVKLRGIRIELEEIENMMTSTPGISAAACILHSAKRKNDVLVAFVAPRGGDQNPHLREVLKAKLPRAMQPHRIIAIDSLPKTERGKVDYYKLSDLLNDSVAGCHSVDQRFTPPSSSAEKTLYSIWEDVLRHTSFGLDESFFEVGGDSINSMVLIQLVEQHFNRRLMLSTLFAHPTLSQLSAWIEHGKHEPMSEYRSLVCLQKSGESKPLYVIHGGDGNVYVHLQLARGFASHRPVYGLQAIGFDGSDSLQSSVEQMAAHYASEILRFQPSGPYHLLGYSAGGWYAWAVATELQKRGADIGLVAVIDTGPTADLHRRLRIQHLLRRQIKALPSRIQAAKRHGQQRLVSQLVRRWKNLRFILWTLLRDRSSNSPGNAESTNPPRPTQPLRGDYFIQIHTYYRPCRLPIRVDVLSTFSQSSANRRLWDFYTKGRVVVHPCMQEHEDFYDDHKVSRLAIQLREILDSIEATMLTSLEASATTELT